MHSTRESLGWATEKSLILESIRAIEPNDAVSLDSMDDW